MQTVTIRLDSLEKVKIPLGFVGENMHRRVIFVCDSMFKQYPSAVAALAIVNPAGVMYPGILTREGNNVLWDIRDSDVAVEGNGEIQLTFTEDTHVAKEYKCKTHITESIVPNSPAPDPVQDWLDYASGLIDGIPDDIAAALAEAKASGEFDGVGIASIAKTGTSGLVDTYTITLDNGGSYDFTVTNGQKGDDGVGIQSIAKTSTSGLVDTYTITLTNGQTSEFTVTNGRDGVQIDDTTPDSNKVFSSAKVAEMNTQLLNAIDEIINGGTVTEISLNRLNPLEIENSTKLKINGTTETENGHWVTGYIDIDSEKTSVAFTGNNIQATARVCLPVSRICFYSSTKAFVSKVDSISSGSITAIPENVKYVRMDLLDAYSSRYPMVEFVDLATDISSEFVEYFNGTVTVPGINEIIENIEENTEDISKLSKRQNEIDAVVPYGLTWDWWISSASIDPFGNAYIGYVDTDSYAGVLRRQPDGTMQYKRLERSWNDDDHNGMATIILDDGKILVIGSHGHAQDNHIICYRSVDPYSIDEMEELSFNIPETGGYAYKTTYSQIFKYDGTLFDFMRVSVQQDSETITNGVGYLCLVSEDDGDTWTAYKAIQSSDPYISFAMSTDEENVIKGVYTNNPGTRPANMIKGFTFDMDTYEFADLSGTKIGELVLLDGGVIADEDIAHYADMTDLVARGEATKSCRLFYVANTPTANTTFLYAIAEDSTNKEWKYKMYQNGTVIDIGYSGVPFGSNTYISGACFGKDTDTAYYAKATTLKADGNHELHKVILSSGAVDSDSIITESSICIIRPLFLGNGEIAVLVGNYNDQNNDGTYKGKYTNWQLKPLFVHASSGGSGAGSDLPNGEGVEF